MTRRPRVPHDRGAAMISTVAGVTVLLVFLLFAVQLLVGLYARTVVTSVAHDGARRVAGSRVAHDDPVAVETARAGAEQRMRDLLGGVGRDASFDWGGSGPDTVVLRVQAESPRFVLPGVGGPLATDHVDRTVTVRVEQLRCPRGASTGTTTAARSRASR